jgi:hypothetical protein
VKNWVIVILKFLYFLSNKFLTLCPKFKMKKVLFLFFFLFISIFADDIKIEPFNAPGITNSLFFDNFNENTIGTLWGLTKNPKFNGIWS